MLSQPWTGQTEPGRQGSLVGNNNILRNRPIYFLFFDGGYIFRFQFVVISFLPLLLLFSDLLLFFLCLKELVKILSISFHGSYLSISGDCWSLLHNVLVLGLGNDGFRVDRDRLPVHVSHFSF